MNNVSYCRFQPGDLRDCARYLGETPDGDEADSRHPLAGELMDIAGVLGWQVDAGGRPLDTSVAMFVEMASDEVDGDKDDDEDEEDEDEEDEEDEDEEDDEDDEEDEEGEDDEDDEEGEDDEEDDEEDDDDEKDDD
jgi:hypothetical protein